MSLALPPLRLQGLGEKRVNAKHLDACYTKTYGELAEEWGEALPDYINPDVKIVSCVRGCPLLEAALVRGEELARIYGWP